MADLSLFKYVHGLLSKVDPPPPFLKREIMNLIRDRVEILILKGYGSVCGPFPGVAHNKMLICYYKCVIHASCNLTCAG